MLVFLAGGVIAATDMQTKQTCNCGCNVEKVEEVKMNTCQNTEFSNLYTASPIPPNIEEKIKNIKLSKADLPTVEEVKKALKQASEITGKNITRVSISPLGIDPQDYEEKIKEYRRAGIEVVTATKGSYKDCNDLTAVLSYVYVEHDDVWYWAKDVSCTTTYECSRIRPEPESSYSDIHFEDWFYFYSDGIRPSTETRGLIVFAGGNNSCGASSTHVKDKYGNLLHYDDFSLDDPDGFLLWGWHVLTIPCPHGDCLTGNSILKYLYPQRLVYQVYSVYT